MAILRPDYKLDAESRQPCLHFADGTFRDPGKSLENFTFPGKGKILQ